MVQTIDACYWEHKGETSRESMQKPKDDNTSKQSSSKPSNNHSSNHSNNQNNLSASSSNKSSKPASFSAPDLSSKLGKDGKLTAEERKQCIDNKLCLFCGSTRHSTHDRQKSSSCATKVCAVLLYLHPLRKPNQVPLLR